MIFCSRRVFLNVLTQLMDLNTLLNANYFLVDQIKPTGYASISDYPVPFMSQTGEVVYGSEQGLDFSQQTKSVSKYFVRYSNVLDVSPFFSVTAASVRNDYTSPLEKFVRHLQKTDTQIAVYDTFFNVTLQGNGLQILIMKDDVGCEQFGDIICSYLAEVFGADVTFIDPQYRPKTKGKLQYIGNKQFAEKHIRELRDAKLKMHIQLMIDTASYGDGLNNLMQYLNNPDLTMEDLFHLYNVIFPNAPLPPGNYTREHLIHIITGQILDSTGRRKEVSELSNLGTSFYAFDQMLNDLDRLIEAADFSDVT